jgi:UDP-N-acetyl-D-galactosamine dehydrogenase
MTVAIVGVGYVGLPLVQAFSKTGRQVVAYDVDRVRVAELMEGYDRNATDDPHMGPMPGVTWTNEPHWLSTATDIIIAVPTPVDQDRRPDFSPMIEAVETVGAHMQRGTMVVIECTVHPGATEELAGPILERISGLRRRQDFHLAYSPERINPGDDAHDLASVVKVVSGEDAETLERVAALYEGIVVAGVHRAPSIQVAEAAKITENVQRDLNIALMNELSQIFDRLNIRTSDVLAAAGTKWNFAKYTPGLVGGHCIGVDPYYLIAKAEAHGYYPEVIRAGRRLNDQMAELVAHKLVLLIGQAGRAVSGARIGVMGCAFKENVSDSRNSQVPPIVRSLKALGADVRVSDPVVQSDGSVTHLGLDLVPTSDLMDLDALLIAAPHRIFLEEGASGLSKRLRPSGVLFDIKSVIAQDGLRADIRYHAL